MRATIVDLGSNTFHVLVADVAGSSIRNIVLDAKIAVRLGERAFAEGRIPEDAYARGLQAIRELSAMLGGHLGGPCRVLATSVFRTAENGPRFLADATEILGVDATVIDGSTEASWTWLGVSSELAGSHGRLAVLDLGGGSLEGVWGDNRVEGAHSLPLGVLRTRHFAHPELREHVVDVAREALSSLIGYAPETLALSSGSARSLLKLARKVGLVADVQRHLWRHTIAELAQTIAPMSATQLGSLGVDAARVDTIATAAITFDALLERLARPVAYVASSATREGALIELVLDIANPVRGSASLYSGSSS